VKAEVLGLRTDEAVFLTTKDTKHTKENKAFLRVLRALRG